jgi:5-methylcytosine-specific restriction endonuclease McrA
MKMRNGLSESFEDFLVRAKLAEVEYGIRLWARMNNLSRDNTPLPTPAGWWDQRRERSLALAGYRCEGCGNGQEWMLQVHHLTYVRKDEQRELDNDLEVLCTPCHKLKHPNKDFNFRGPDGKRY